MSVKIGIGSGRVGPGKERRLFPCVWICSCFVGAKTEVADPAAALAACEEDADDDGDRPASSMSSVAPACSV